jgi:hypothetical protein
MADRPREPHDAASSPCARPGAGTDAERPAARLTGGLSDSVLAEQVGEDRHTAVGVVAGVGEVESHGSE